MSLLEAVSSTVTPVLMKGYADVSLRALLKRRDEQAAAWLFDELGDEVNRIVWRLLGGDSEHDDIVHETMCSILKSAHRVNDLSRLKSWARSVAVNTVKMTLRRRKWRRLFSELSEEIEEERFETWVPDEQKREEVRNLYRALKHLSSEERIALVLRHVEEFELTEVADACQVSLATIKRWLQKAEQKLKERLQWGGES